MRPTLLTFALLSCAITAGCTTCGYQYRASAIAVPESRGARDARDDLVAAVTRAIAPIGVMTGPVGVPERNTVIFQVQRESAVSSGRVTVLVDLDTSSIEIRDLYSAKPTALDVLVQDAIREEVRGVSGSPIAFTASPQRYSQCPDWP